MHGVRQAPVPPAGQVLFAVQRAGDRAAVAAHVRSLRRGPPVSALGSRRTHLRQPQQLPSGVLLPHQSATRLEEHPGGNFRRLPVLAGGCDYGNTKITSMHLYPQSRNVAAQMAEEFTTVTYATPPHMEERRKK